MITIEVFHQFFATISANIIAFSFGWSNAWANANFIHFMSKETSLDSGPFTNNEASLFMSLICVGGLFGNLIYLWVLDKFGRKLPILFLALPIFASWLLIVYAQNVYWLYISRILSGFSTGAMFIAVPIFIAEICSDNVRGLINALGFMITSLGTLFGFFIALYLDFRMQAACALAIPLIFVLTFIFVPESPVYLYKTNQTTLANKSSKYYNGSNRVSELEKLKKDEQLKLRRLDSFNESAMNFRETNNENEKTDLTQQMYKELPSDSKDEPISLNANHSVQNLRDCVKSGAVRRAIYISVMLVILPQLSGCFILLSYSTAYFKEAGSSLTPLQSSILICVVQLIANLFTMILVERLGRKILFITSSVGSGLGLIALALHNWYINEFPNTNWVPIYGLSFTIFLASVGLLNIPFIITIDVLPINMREITMTVTAILMWFLGFATNAAYLRLLELIQLYGCLLIFSVGCFCCALYAFIFIPETKGKSYEQIAKSLEKR